MNKTYNTTTRMQQYRVTILTTVLLTFFISNISPVSAKPQSNQSVLEKFLLCEISSGSVVTGPGPNGYSKCCEKAVAGVKKCFIVNTGKHDAKAFLESNVEQPVMPTNNTSVIAPNNQTLPVKPVAPTLGSIEAATPTSADREASKPSKSSLPVIAPSNRKIPVTLGTLKPDSTRTKIVSPRLPKVTNIKVKKPARVKATRSKAITPKSYTPIGKSTVIVPNNRVEPVQPVSSRTKINKGTSNFDEADTLFGKRTNRLK